MSMDAFDPRRFRAVIPVTKVTTRAEQVRPRRRSKPKGEYLGAVNWDWLAVASKLPGKTLHVAVVVWHLRNLRQAASVRWEPSKAESLGLSRQAVYAGLKRLEAAGLISVSRRIGRCPIVEIRDLGDREGSNVP